MFIIGNLFVATARVLDIALTLYMWVIIIRALISWVNPDPYNPIVRFLRAITDPFLFWIRRTLRLFYTPIDISPLIAILLILFVKYFLVATLFRLGISLGGKPL
ncbi:MAG: YggT family protein [Candidatus Hydrothermota bacterium]|nr:MAG: YggT family protein [Candidatus Hydrothermae bacterium]